MSWTLRMCLILGIAVVRLFAQNADPLSDPWTLGLAFRRVLQDSIPLQQIVLWPAPLAGLPELLPSVEQPPYAAWHNSPPHAGFQLFPNIGRHRFLATVSDSLFHLIANLSFMSRGGHIRYGDTSSSFLLARLGIQAFFRYGKHAEGFLDVSNGARLAGIPEAAARVDPSLGRTLKFSIEARRYFDRYAGYVQLRWGKARVRFGREALSIGYSPIDNLILSPQAPMLDGLLLDLVHNHVRFSYLHASAEGTDTAGLPVRSKYIALHRIGWEPMPGLSFALYDMIVYSGRGLDFSYLNPLAFFVSAGLQTTEKSNQDNSLLALEMALRPRQGSLLYGTLLVDDINYSTLFDTTTAGNSNKFAFQIGAVGLLPISTMGLQVALEYVRIAPFVFTHRTIVNSWTHLNAPLGYDMQPNSDRWALQLRYWIAPRITLTTSIDYTRHGENFLGPDGRLLTEVRNGVVLPIGNVGGNVLRGDGDVLAPNRFLRGKRSDTRRFHLQLAAEWLPNVISFFTVGYFNRTGGNFPLQQLWGTLEFRFGY
ncbi:MAG: hypothetical protein NZ473_00685 [Candidatus Kapabacteria bacterium]|nr:hypothetical protein [Candidatus Kapabacteria bacterium]